MVARITFTCVMLAIVLAGGLSTACATGPGSSAQISDANVIGWVGKALAERRVTAADRRFDQIGWAQDIRAAIKLGREHNRPILLFTGDGRMNTGRC
jgi:hypothetical protein